MAYTETTTTTYGQRVKKSFGGIGSGILLFIDVYKRQHTDPFEPVIKQDPTGQAAIYARGANDDKGQLFMHIKAFEYLLRSGKLRHNVKLIFEGEEEIGSPSLPAWVKEQ